MRKLKDILMNLITYLFSSFGVLILGTILVFIFSNGFSTLSWNLLTSDYYETVYTLKYETDNSNGTYNNPNLDDSYFSSRWGVAFKDTTNNEGENIIIISYLDPLSPLKRMTNVGTDSVVSAELNQVVTKVILNDENANLIIGLAKNGALTMASTFDSGITISNLVVTTSGGGIRGSLLTTLLMIVLTLLIALPLGIGGAVYLSEYAPDTRGTRILRNMIDMTSGIPSIIFGLVGAIVFIPFMNSLIGSDGGSIASGSLTLAIMLLPIIIKTTEESIKTISSSYRSASLALGASKTQTTFKVILPNAFSGILTSVLLSIGRIIGESAALIYAVGTAIKDNVSIDENSTTLAVHIWSLMSGENPNYELSYAISIVILFMVLFLSILVKIIAKRFKSYEVK